MRKHRVVIVGGGFGGLHAAKHLKDDRIEVTLVDRRNFHLFQPLLYQVATGALSPGDIATPLRHILRRRSNVRVIMGDVTAVDPHGRRVILTDAELPYDSVIISTGSSHHYFGHEEWAVSAPGVKSIEDATTIRGRILRAFEAAERETDPERVLSQLTFVIVGGGPTGVELAGALGEIAKDTLRHEFRRISSQAARIILVEGADRILPSYPPGLSRKAELALQRFGVELLKQSLLTAVEGERVVIRSAVGDRTISAGTIIWAAGVKASPLTQALSQVTGCELDKAGRVKVAPDLSIPGFPEIFVIGDMAGLLRNGSQLPGIAPVAIQQGQYLARVIENRLRNRTAPPFKYRHQGNLATIGRSAAVADFGWLQLSGFPAWVLWLFVHLMKLVEFENRLLVFMQWAWNYFTYNRSARLITGAGSGNQSSAAPSRELAVSAQEITPKSP